MKQKQLKLKTIVICTPGESFSNIWVKCLLDLWMWCYQNGYQPILSQATSNNIYYVRNMCLGANVMRGRKQKPFDGKLEYGYLLWIDSDSLVVPGQLENLLKADKDIIGGLQAFEGGQGFTCGKLDDDYFKKKGIMPYHTEQTLAMVKKGLLEVDYCGFGLMLIKKGVFEKLDYPWFKPTWFEYGKIRDFSMEDVSFCIRARKKGFKVFVDPQVRVGHLKKAIY